MRDHPKNALLILLVLALLPGCGSDPVDPQGPPAGGGVVFEYEHPFPVESIHDMWGTASDDVYAVGAYGEILHYDGAGWTSMQTPTRWLLLNVWGTSASNIVAVGSGGVILRFDGTEWHSEASGTGQPLFGVWGCAPDTFFAVGYSGTIVRFDGSEWQKLPEPTSSDLLRVWGTSARNIYVGARDALLHYDGNSWTDVGIEVRVRVIGIWGSSVDDIWVTDGTNLLWHYDGSSWENVRGSWEYPYTSLWGFASNDVFGAGQGGMVSHYDGATWVQQDAFGTFFLDGIWGASNTDVWACGTTGTGGALFHYDGSEWTREGNTVVDAHFEDIWSDAAGERAFAVSDDEIVQMMDGEWSLSPVVPPSRLNAVWGAPTGEVFAVGEHGVCLLIEGDASEDIGPGGADLHFTDVWGSSRDNVYVIAFQGVWRYNGVGWETPAPADRPRAVWGADEANVFYAGHSEQGYGVVRHFNGDAWETIFDDSTAGVWGLAGRGARDLLIPTSTDDGRNQLRRYDGSAWRDVTPPGLSRFRVLAGNRREGYLVFGENLDGHTSTDRTLMLLADDTWEQLDPPYGNTVRGAWGGLDDGFYLVNRAQIFRCLIE